MGTPKPGAARLVRRPRIGRDPRTVFGRQLANAPVELVPRLAPRCPCLGHRLPRATKVATAGLACLNQKRKIPPNSHRRIYLFSSDPQAWSALGSSHGARNDAPPAIHSRAARSLPAARAYETQCTSERLRWSGSMVPRRRQLLLAARCGLQPWGSYYQRVSDGRTGRSIAPRKRVPAPVSAPGTVLGLFRLPRREAVRLGTQLCK